MPIVRVPSCHPPFAPRHATEPSHVMPCVYSFSSCHRTQVRIGISNAKLYDHSPTPQVAKGILH